MSVTLDAFLTLVLLLLAGAACAEVPGWSFGTKSGGARRARARFQTKPQQKESRVSVYSFIPRLSGVALLRGVKVWSARGSPRRAPSPDGTS